MPTALVIKPNATEELAISLVHKLYGLEVTNISRMDSFDDQNFHIKVSKQHRNPNILEIYENGYTLKITNATKSAEDGHFDTMHSTMIHLNEKGVRVPSPVRNLDGGTWTLESVPLLNEDSTVSGPKLCGVHLLTFLEGATVSTVEYTSDVLYQWGLCLANFHTSVEDFENFSLRRKPISWCLENVPDIKNYLQGFEDTKQKLILTVLDRYETEVMTNLKNLPKGFIHGDLNEYNVLVQPKTSESGEVLYVVDGVLDFEDIHYGTYAWDIGVMLAYTLLECETMDPLVGAGHALAGYLSQRPVSNLEISLLKVCIESRLSQSLALCAYSFIQDPNNAYLMASSAQKWARLEQLCGVSNSDLLQKWAEVVNHYQSGKLTISDKTNLL